MILVRRRTGIAYFLAHDREDDGLLAELTQRYPGSPVAIVERREGLILLRVGRKAAVAGTSAEDGAERFAIVGLRLRATVGATTASPAAW